MDPSRIIFHLKYKEQLKGGSTELNNRQNKNFSKERKNIFLNQNHNLQIK